MPAIHFGISAMPAGSSAFSRRARRRTGIMISASSSATNARIETTRTMTSSMEPPRTIAQRRADARLAADVDLWVASADAAGNAYLVPLSYHWDGEAQTVSTPRASRTAVNLTRAGTARVALGATRDIGDDRRIRGAGC